VCQLHLQALKEAFEVFCNKGVAGSTSAELLAAFCDNLLKKGGSEKLSDEAIEDTLEKVLISGQLSMFSVMRWEVPTGFEQACLLNVVKIWTTSCR
jgi:hypothetical protein